MRGYGMELSTKSLLDHSRPTKELNWIVLTIMILWRRFSLHSKRPNLVVSRWSVYLCTTIILSHASKLMSEFLAYEIFTGQKIKEWSQSRLDLNPIENLWSIVKKKYMRVADNITAKQTNRKQLKLPENELAEVKKKSMYYRLLVVNEKKGCYNKM